MVKKNKIANQVFILIDFNASKRYSHHWTYLDAYRVFLESYNLKYEIWIPENSDKEILDDLGKNVKNILRSISYGFERNENFKSWLMVKSIAWIFKFLKVMVSNHFLEKIKNLICVIYFLPIYKRLHKLDNGRNIINLVFPTADSLSLRLSRYCLKKEIQIESIAIRAIGVKFKDIFKINDSEIFYKNLIKDFPNCDVRIGYETTVYKIELLKSGIKPSSICWAPIPSFSISKLVKGNDRKYTLGFLGTARPNKGFENIPLLVEALSESETYFIAQVQKAVYPWPEYLYALEKLEQMSSFVEVLPENISYSSLQKLMSNIDVLILPYNVIDYQVAGSGLLFMAADYGVPVLATKGVAFEWDICEYSLGMVFQGLNEFNQKIRILMESKNVYDFQRYNSDRNSAIKEFLRINL
jgi:hypothetical protein